MDVYESVSVGQCPRCGNSHGNLEIIETRYGIEYRCYDCKTMGNTDGGETLDYLDYLRVILSGEPVDLDECLCCGRDVSLCHCPASRCVVCSGHADLTDDGLCGECDWQIKR